MEPSDWSKLPSILYIKEKQIFFTFRKWTETVFKTTVLQDCVGFHSLRQRVTKDTQFGVLYMSLKTCCFKYRFETDSGKTDYLTKMAIPEVFKSVGQTVIHTLTVIQHCNVHENNKTVFSKMWGTLCKFDRWICELENLLIKKVFWQFFISISKKRREWRVFIAVLVSRQFAISDLKAGRGRVGLINFTEDFQTVIH